MNPLLMLAIRHGLTVLGGVLAAKGTIPAESVEAAVTATETVLGSGAVLVGIAMSVMDKKKRG